MGDELSWKGYFKEITWVILLIIVFLSIIKVIGYDTSFKLDNGK